MCVCVCVCVRARVSHSLVWCDGEELRDSESSSIIDTSVDFLMWYALQLRVVVPTSSNLEGERETGRGREGEREGGREGGR